MNQYGTDMYNGRSTHREQIRRDEELKKEVQEDRQKIKYLRKFEKHVHPKTYIEMKVDNEEKIMAIGDEIIEILKEQELTYVDAYIALEYAYRKLKFNSEYTHL